MPVIVLSMPLVLWLMAAKVMVYVPGLLIVAGFEPLLLATPKSTVSAEEERAALVPPSMILSVNNNPIELVLTSLFLASSTTTSYFSGAFTAVSGGGSLRNARWRPVISNWLLTAVVSPWSSV